jgi:PAS domain S-box-containing protein
MMPDISDRKEEKIALHKMKNNVKYQMNLTNKRTTQLAEVNAQLMPGIKQRKKAERELRATAKTLQSLINATTNLVMLLDVDGTLVTANDQACERYGKTLQELKGINIFSLMPTELAKSRKKLADGAIRSKQPVCCFEEIDGMFYYSTIYPILDDKGVVRQYSVFLQDITPLKLAEKDLKQREKNFKALAENANDGIILIEEGGKIIYVNSCFAKISGYSVSELQKYGLAKLVDPAKKELHLEKLRQRLAGEPVPNRYESELVTKSGHALPVEVTASKTIWQGEPVAMMVVRDITAQTQTVAELMRAQLKLEQRVKERTKELLETNNALSVLARNIDQKREKVQEKTNRTVSSKILPIIEQFQKKKTFTKHRVEIDLLKAYLNELTDDSIDEPGVIFILSNAELRVATMIKNGFSSPEIARLLSVSQDTIKTHRKNIRRKLNISNTKINLTTYLREKLR